MSNKELTSILENAIKSMQNGDNDDSSVSGWKAPASKPVNAPFLGVSIPIKVETPQGSARCYLSLPPEVAASPETLLGAIKQLLDMGIPVDLYQPRQNNDWNGGGNNNGNGGGWRANGGYGGGQGGFRGNGGGNGGYTRRW